MPYYTPANFVPDCSAGYLLRRCHQLSLEGLEPVFAAADLTNMQWSALITILVGRASTGAELAREISYDKGATTRLIDTLEAKGWLTRSRDVADRRIVKLTLSAEGAELAERVKLQVIDRWNEWLGHWKHDEAAALLAMLQRLRDQLNDDVRGDRG